MIKIAYLVSEPIYYQEPMLRRLAAMDDVHLTVFFRSKRSLREHKLEGFGVEAQWDVDFLKGYDYQFLGVIGSDMNFTPLKPVNYGLGQALKQGNYDVLWVHGYNNVYNINALRLAKRLGMKTLVRGESTLFSCESGLIRKMGRRPFFKLLDRWVDGYLTIGQCNRSFYRHYNVDESKLYFAPYTVDNEKFQQNSQHEMETLKGQMGISQHDPVILFACKMQQRKRGKDLIEAFAHMMRSGVNISPHLIMVGDGPQKPMLERLVSDYGLENVHFQGFQNQSQLMTYYALADIFVLPSEREPWGLVVNEAMSGRCAIVTTTDVGSAYDLVDESNGAVYQPGDIKALSRALYKFTQNPEFCQRAKELSQRRISQWDIQHTAEGVRQAARAVTQ